EQGFARIEKGNDYLAISDGGLRGPEIGSTFQRTPYDASGRLSVTGASMPAYAPYRRCAHIPSVGVPAGNGRARGPFGSAHQQARDAKAPQLTISPISAIAPGVFRNIFQFH